MKFYISRLREPLFQPLTMSSKGWGGEGGWGLRGRTESIAFYQYGVNCSKRSQYMHLLFKKIMHTVTYNLTRTMWLSDLSSGDHPDNHSDSRTEAISVQ